jgi:hypothetical protein
MHAARPPTPGFIAVQALAPRVIFTEVVGHVKLDAAESAWQQFREIVTAVQRPVWLSDARALKGFDPRTLALGARWFAAFRQRGGQHCVVTAEAPMAMMAASTMALGLGVRIHAFTSLDEARQRALSLLSGA